MARTGGILLVAVIAASIVVVGLQRTSHRAHAAARLASETCHFIILPGHSDTKSYTYADGDTVTVHSQLYESIDTVTGEYCGQLESITTISDNGHGAPVYGMGMDELVFRLPNGQYPGVGGGHLGYSNAFTGTSALQPIAETTTCAAPGGSFAPKDHNLPTITTGAANYCPPQ